MKIASMKNEKPSDREAQSEHAAEARHELRPQQPELEAQNRAGHHAHREQCEHHPRPAAGDRAQDRVAGAQGTPLGEDDHRRERHAEAHERDVHRERQRLHLARLEQVPLVDRREGVATGGEEAVDQGGSGHHCPFRRPTRSRRSTAYITVSRLP
jgi:hypothetical protein